MKYTPRTTGCFKEGVVKSMLPTPENINWHDMYLLKVEEIVDENILLWWIKCDISENYDGSKYTKCIIEFHGVSKYSVNEGSVVHGPTILEMEMQTIDQGYGLGMINYMKFGTTAGHREIYCSHYLMKPTPN